MIDDDNDERLRQNIPPPPPGSAAAADRATPAGRDGEDISARGARKSLLIYFETQSI